MASIVTFSSSLMSFSRSSIVKVIFDFLKLYGLEGGMEEPFSMQLFSSGLFFVILESGGLFPLISKKDCLTDSISSIGSLSKQQDLPFSSAANGRKTCSLTTLFGRKEQLAEAESHCLRCYRQLQAIVLGVTNSCMLLC